MKNKGTAFKAPNRIVRTGNLSFFLAGTIDMGNSIDWQKQAEIALNERGFDTYNPRRINWNPDWEQTKENSVFHEQVTWELNAMEQADVVIYNFLPDSMSPVTLMELGLHVNPKAAKQLVCCPDEFYRSGNVHILCERYKIPLYKDFNKLLESFNV